MEKLFKAALAVMNKSYSPYSQYKVSAALRSNEDKIYVGVNIENASYPCGICAEGSAIANMITDGGTQIKELLVIADYETAEEIAAPCGLCRQRIREFAVKDLPIHLANTKQIFKTVTLEELLYMSFGPENLKR